MTTLTTVIFTSTIVCFVLLVLNFTVKTSLGSWRLVTGGVLTLAILVLIVSYIVATHK